MKEKIESLISKMQILKTLPQNEYRSVGEAILPGLVELKAKFDDYLRELRDEEEKKLYDLLQRRAEKPNEVLYYDIGKFAYGITVTKTPIKK